MGAKEMSIIIIDSIAASKFVTIGPVAAGDACTVISAVAIES